MHNLATKLEFVRSCAFQHIRRMREHTIRLKIDKAALSKEVLVQDFTSSEVHNFEELNEQA